MALDLAENVFDDLPDRRVLVIGAGRMAEATTLSLMQHGVSEIVVANRTVGTARELAERFGGRGVGFDRLPRSSRPPTSSSRPPTRPTRSCAAASSSRSCPAARAARW